MLHVCNLPLSRPKREELTASFHREGCRRLKRPTDFLLKEKACQTLQMTSSLLVGPAHSPQCLQLSQLLYYQRLRNVPRG